MLEIIVETVEDALAAEAGGATQLLLESDFVEDGLSPTAGMVQRVCSQVSVDTIVSVRTYGHPRTSPNLYVLTSNDLAVMCDDIRLAADRGAKGFLLGALTPDRNIDHHAIEVFQDAAGGLPFHFHLAWEITSDPAAALEELISLGVQSVRNTGGQAPGGRAIDAMAQIRSFYEATAGRIEHFLTGGVNSENVGELVRNTGVVNAHAGSSVREPSTTKGVVIESKVRELRKALDQAIDGD